eukprot:SAG11_NODE_7034_length_1205_cov_1.239602_2_plen_197_part_00
MGGAAMAAHGSVGGGQAEVETRNLADGATDGGSALSTAAHGWLARDAALAAAYTLLGELLESSGALSRPAAAHVGGAVRKFWDRPFSVVCVDGGETSCVCSASACFAVRLLVIFSGAVLSIESVCRTPRHLAFRLLADIEAEIVDPEIRRWCKVRPIGGAAQLSVLTMDACLRVYWPSCGCARASARTSHIDWPRV